MPCRAATPLRPPGGPRNRLPNPPPVEPYCGCIAGQASADIERCAVQTFAGAKNSAARIDVTFVGVRSWRAANGAVPRRATPTTNAATRRYVGWSMDFFGQDTTGPQDGTTKSPGRR